MLCGGAGHAYGHEGWDFPREWLRIINYPTRLIAYLPQPGIVTVDLGQLKGAELTARWFDPRTGAFGKSESLAGKSGLKRFGSPPQDDWVLVIQP